MIVSYLRYTNSRRNGLINEANKLIDEGDAAKKQLGSNADLLIAGAMPQELASDRTKLEEAVGKASGLLAKAIESYPRRRSSTKEAD